MSDKRSDVAKIESEFINLIKKATEISATAVVNKANSIVYANTRFANNTFRESIVKSSALYSGGDVNIDIRFSPYNIRSKKSPVYAKPLDEGHRLVYFGKPTSKFIAGKHFSEPARNTGMIVLEKMISEI